MMTANVGFSSVDIRAGRGAYRRVGPPVSGSRHADSTAVLTTHFGDPAWIELLLLRLLPQLPGVGIGDVYVIDQDRRPDSAAMLRDRLGDVRVLQYGRSEPHFETTGHDHAYVLNCAVRDIPAETLLLFDSDAHPVGRTFGQRLRELLARYDAVLAANATSGDESHPCFMVLGAGADREALRFDEEQLETGVDTGRRIFRQLAGRGVSVELLRPQPAFGGHWGTLFLDGSVYHHGSGSFPANPDPRIRRQVETWDREDRFFRKRVFRGRYTLDARDRVAFRLLELRRWADRQRTSNA